MKHTPSDVKVYVSSDYSKFSFINGNRPLNPGKIDRIIEEIEGGNDMLKDYPIQVRENGGGVEILDGQNRFMIDKKLKRPVYYIVVSDDKDMADIASVNSNTEKWSQMNYVNCYIQNKNQNYVKLKKFIEEFKIDIGTSLLLLQTGGPISIVYGSDIRESFRKGKFEVMFWDEAVSFSKDVAKFSASPYHKDRTFMMAIHKIKKAGKITLAELLEKFNKNPEMLQKHAVVKGYIYNLEEIASIGKHKRLQLT